MKQKTTKRAMSMALAVAMALAPVQAMAATDVSGHWAEKVIKQWQDKGLISGYQDGTFKPNNNITRAEFVVIMNNAMGFDHEGSSPFKDVNSDDWFNKAVTIAVGEGYISGYEDGTFKPNATITRAEAAVMIAKVAGLQSNEAGAFKFSDNGSIPSWARGSVGAAVEAGYMSGYPDGTFGATKPITRAEAVSSLNRMLLDAEDKVEESKDVIVDKDDTIIKDQVIEGDLIISEKVGDGEVTVKDTTVKGDIIVRGGGDDSIYLENVTAEGIISIEKKDVRVQLEGSTTVSDIEVKEECTLSSINFTGSVDTITITDAVAENGDVTIKVPADKVIVDADVNVKIQKDVDLIEVSENAKGAEIEIANGVTVDKIVADAKIDITGSGTVKDLEANADGIKIDTKVDVDDIIVADGVSKPTTGSSSSGGGGGSSSSDDDDSSDDKPTAAKKELKKELDAANQKKSGVKISTDGTDIPADQKWVTQDMMNTFEAAIASAQKVYDTSNSKNTIKNATKDLQAAIAAFKPENGKKLRQAN